MVSKNFLYFSLLLIADSFTIELKVSLSKAHKTQSVFAYIVAALGALYNKASSPNNSPSLYVFKYVGGSPLLKIFSLAL